MRRLSRTAGLGTGLAGLSLLAACGSRLPDRDFAAAQRYVVTSTGGGTEASPGAVVDVNGTPVPVQAPASGAGAPVPALPGASATGGRAPAAGPPAAGGAPSGGPTGNRPGGAPATKAASRPGSATAPRASGPNPASDVGVAPTTITVGIITSKSSAIGGPDTFGLSEYGARAYFKQLNATGGLSGRTVQVQYCDDGGTAAGNEDCVRSLIDDAKVFAFAGNTIYAYAGAKFVNDHAVPDVGGQPVGDAYDQYPHLWSIYDTTSPRDGQHVGYNGTLYGGTEVYRYFKVRYGARNAGIVYYNQAASQRFALYQQKAAQAEGYNVVMESVNLFSQDYSGVVADMKSKRVDTVFDALDLGGNENLCQAMDDGGLAVKAKVSTIQAWTAAIGTQFTSARCRNEIFAEGQSRNYDDLRAPGVKPYRDAMATYEPGRPLGQWSLEGWASAQLLTDAMRGCGAALTRVCAENFLRAQTAYTGGGLLSPRSWQPRPPGATTHNCVEVGRWQDSANGGAGGWVTDADLDDRRYCWNDLPTIAYQG